LVEYIYISVHLGCCHYHQYCSNVDDDDSYAVHSTISRSRLAHLFTLSLWVWSL